MNTDSNSNIISPYVRTIKLSKSFFLDSRSIKLQKFNEKINYLKKMNNLIIYGCGGAAIEFLSLYSNKIKKNLKTYFY